MPAPLEDAPFPTLTTERLLLREIRRDDAPDVLAIQGDAQLMRWFGNDPLPDLDAAIGLVQIFERWRQAPMSGIRWGIQARTGGPLLGTCGLFQWNRLWRSCFVGYELAAAAHGQGFMREALREALAWGFDHMRLNRIEALIHPDNHPSRKVAEHFGFRPEGLLRQVAYWGGRHHDMTLFALLREDWPSRDPG